MSRTTHSSRLVVTTLRGGLGNQMFQYALARCIAERDTREVVLDDSLLGARSPRITPRSYALNMFRIRAPLSSHATPLAHPTLVRAFVVEQRPGFCRDVLRPSPYPCLHLSGFWQSEKYFKEIAPLIRRVFQLRHVDEGKKWRAAIAAERSPICLHVRRTDYLAPQGRHVGFVGMDYYRRAVRLVAETVPDPHFFVFSDDLDWCERSLDLRHPHTFVRHRGLAERHAIDLKLMTMCKYFIIANSSFSWWGAWLCANPKKIVVAPKRWFGSPLFDSRDVTPASWIRV